MPFDDRPRMRFRVISAILFFIIFSSLGMPGRSSAEAAADIFSRGRGPTEVLVFTDYFCPPCQAVEPYLEKGLAELHRSGVKVTFVDKPLHAQTPLYSRYFLYAAKKADRFEEVLRIRRILFDLAKSRKVEAEGQLIAEMKANKVRLGLFDVQPVFGQWMELIRRYAVRSTPTCVVLRPGQEPSTFSGTGKIPEGIDRLLQERSVPSAEAAPPQPRAFLPESLFEFPTAVEGTRVVHEFVLQNRGTAALEILDIKSG